MCVSLDACAILQLRVAVPMPMRMRSRPNNTSFERDVAIARAVFTRAICMCMLQLPVNFSTQSHMGYICMPKHIVNARPRARNQKDAWAHCGL